MRTRLVALVVLAVVAAACGGVEDVSADPRGALEDAVQRMSSWDGMEVAFRVDSTVDSLVTGEGIDPMTEDEASVLLASSFTLRSFHGDLADPEDDRAETVVDVDGITALQYRQFGTEETYVRSELQKFLTRFGSTTEDHAEFVDDLRAIGVDFVDEALAGEWLALRGMDELARMYSGMTGLEVPSPEEAESLRAEMSDRVRQFLRERVSVTYVGADDIGEHVRATATARDVVGFVFDAFELLGASGGPFGATGIGGEDMFDAMRDEVVNDLGDTEVSLDVWLADGHVKRLAFDVVAFAAANPDFASDFPSGVERLAVVADLAEFGGDLDVPDAAAEVDVFRLVGQFMGQAFGSFEGGLEGEAGAWMVVEEEATAVEVEAVPASPSP